VGDTNFEFAVREGNGRATMVLRGDLDAYTGQRFSECLQTTIAGTKGDVAMDMSDVSFVDSSGIAILVATAKSLRERGNNLVIQSPPPMLTKVLEMTGVTKLVRLEGRRR
jgi:anti-anti-sigma factor